MAGDIDHIGIRAHHFRPADSTPHCVNRFPIRVSERLESQFEWNVVFTTTDAPQPQKMWWMINKDQYSGGIPETLAVAPEHILLLKSGLPE